VLEMILRRDENGQYRQMKSLDDRTVSRTATRRVGEKEEYESSLDVATSHGAYNSGAYFRDGTCSLRVGEHPWKRFLTVPS